jgi:hypothetical protein
MVEVGHSSFVNVVARLKVLNLGVEFVEAGLNEFKEVIDGVVASPPPSED